MLIHRDVKPANIFLAMTADGREVTKVLDFGIATKVEADQEGGERKKKRKSTDLGSLPHDARLTAVGTIMGTPLYVAPEVLIGEHASDKADQYSLAATAFHLLTGRPVFTAETMEELLFKTIEDPPVKPSDVHSSAQLPPGLDGVLVRALSKEPDERYESMESFRQALEPFAAAAGASSSVLDLRK
jgi:serine/threonine-protein kinase